MCRHPITRQTKLECKYTGVLYYIDNIYIDSEDCSVIVIGAYGEKYMSRPYHETVSGIRDKFIIREDL